MVERRLFAIEKDSQAQYPEQTAQVKMSVSRNRAAVFVDERYLGHVDQFDGLGEVPASPGAFILAICGKQGTLIVRDRNW